ncbi:response regulator transcription factor [Chitinilyticum piscinae]|uniref:Response regulator n=1 Tax=Chitinilyticum piscinae TaxID=2866724 RepID=A0A8J7K2G7_9NEIS|nr:response regulator [Chitinilyticum piscinae]MBE9610012.1 response regulator [Chitinilyticum piscinae]
MKKILLIDNDSAQCEQLAAQLGEQGYTVCCAHSSVEGRKLALAEKPDAIVTEAMLETDTAGFELVYQIRDERPDSRYREIRHTPILLLTGIDQHTHFRFSLNEKQSYLPPIAGMLSKPAQLDTLLEKLQEMVG